MAGASERSTKDTWDKLSSLSGLVAAVMVPIVIAFVGNWYSFGLKEREIALSDEAQKREWVQVGLSILRDAKATEEMAQWAFDIINQNSSVKMPTTTKQIFVAQGRVLPAATQTRIDPADSTDDRLSSVIALQIQGIDALLRKDFPKALIAYDKAYETWPRFRNVDEIKRFLHKQPSSPSSEQQWQDLYTKILNFDLRGVDQDLLQQLRAARSS